MSHYSAIENQWVKKGKKYQTKCLAALKQLYGGWNDMDCHGTTNGIGQTQEETQQHRGNGTGQVLDLVEEKGR